MYVVMSLIRVRCPVCGVWTYDVCSNVLDQSEMYSVWCVDM